MTSLRKQENIVVSIGLLIILAISAYSIVYSRAAVRNDLRKQDITNLKHALEGYFNKHQFYLTGPNKKPECTSSSGDSWAISDASPLLKEQLIDAIPHDLHESKGSVYTYCVTKLDRNNHAQGYYLQAQLESQEPEGSLFDEDEKRKFYSRIIKEDHQLLYRVCGGTETQCQPTRIESEN